MKRGILLLLAVFLGLVASAQKSKDLHIIRALNADVAYLASDDLEGRETGTEGEEKAAEYIKKRYEELKLLPKGTDGYYQDFQRKPKAKAHSEKPVDTTKTIRVRNVIGYLDNQAEHTVVIGAHYDHLGHGIEGSLHQGGDAIHNGADDNASGVAAILQMVPQLRSKYRGNNYLIVMFSGEEMGLLGSNYYCKNPTIDLSKVNYMINLDMVGRLTEEKKIAINGVGTSPSWPPVIEYVKVDSLQPVTSESGVGPSDHTSFYLQDIPVLHFFTGQHEDYHKPSDDLDKVNFKGMVSVMKYILKIIGQLDDDGKLEFTQTKDEESTKAPKYSVTLGVIPDYLFDGVGMRLDGVKEDRPAAKAGMMKGDIVLQMGDVQINNMMDYMKALGMFKKGESVKAKVKRGEETLELGVTF